MFIFVGVSEDIAGEFAFISLLKRKALKNVKNLAIDKHLKNKIQYNSVVLRLQKEQLSQSCFFLH